MSVDIREYTELEIIEECFKAPHCEHPHEESVCLHTPVAKVLFSCDRMTYPVCRNVVDYVTHERLDPLSDCEECERPCSVCWHITPLT